MADDADSQAGVYLTGTTRHPPAGRDYEYFRDAVADLYVGIRPDVPDGRFDADFMLYRLGGTRLGFLSTPAEDRMADGLDSARHRSGLARPGLYASLATAMVPA